MSEKVEHTPGPWHQRDSNVAEAENIMVDCGDRAQPHTVGAIAVVLNFGGYMSFTDGQARCDARMRTNADLITLAPTAPHYCSVDGCPGNHNRQQLDMLPEAARLIQKAEEAGIPDSWRFRAWLARYRELETLRAWEGE